MFSHMAIYEGSLIGTGLKFALVQSRLNDFVDQQLLSGAQNALKQHGVLAASIDVIFVPGIWELAFAAQRLAQSRRYDGIVTLGIISQEQSSSADTIIMEMNRLLAQTARETGIPVSSGIVTVDAADQTIGRASTNLTDHGLKAALVSLEMATLVRYLGNQLTF